MLEVDLGIIPAVGEANCLVPHRLVVARGCGGSFQFPVNADRLPISIKDDPKGSSFGTIIRQLVPFSPGVSTIGIKTSGDLWRTRTGFDQMGRRIDSVQRGASQRFPKYSRLLLRREVDPAK